jgi:tetratricopeptide (TPR) repeat protein
VRLKNRRYGGLSRRRRSSSGWFWTGLFVVAALLVGGYLLVQTRLGNGIQLGRNVRTPTPALTATPTRGVDDFIQQASVAEAKGDYRQAIDALDKASRRRPNDPDLHRRAARLFVYIGQPIQAEQRARKGLEIDSSHLPSRATLCMALEWQKRIQEAIDACTVVVSADPKYALGHAYLSEAQADSGDFNSALESAQTAVDLEPENPDTLRNLGYVYDVFGQYDTALYHYQRALERSPNLPHVLNAIGRIYYIQGKYDSAVKTLSLIIEMDSANDEAFFQLGNVYQVQGEFGQARRAFDKAIELNPQRLKAWVRRGEVNFATRNFFGAVDDYSRAITVSQQISGTLTAYDYLNYGFSLQWIQECDKAVEMWNKATELAPGDETIQGNIAVGLQRCGR